jgi:VWFA-related protein
VERAGTRLVQLDITVLGDTEALRGLGKDDFRIKINLHKVTDYVLDRVCGEAGAAPGTAQGTVEEPTPRVAEPRPHASYLFYFDQPHLTLAGRQRALDLARGLIERLLGEGDRGMIVSNAAKLKVVQRLTTDHQALLAGLDRLEGDREQWDVWAEQEKTRIDEVVRRLNDQMDVEHAIALARIYQKEERWRTEQNLRRLEMALGPLADLELPKSLVYFADTLRSNPGEHYLSFFGGELRHLSPGLTAMTSDGMTSRNPFDRVVNEAAAQGIRIYSVEARGMESGLDMSGLNPRAYDKAGEVSSNSRVRLVDAQRTLGDMATETGGRAFLHGVRAPKIADRILEDSSCLFVASFDPVRFRKDVPLRVSVEVTRPGVRVRSRGRLIFPSESSRLTTRLLRAFGSAEEIQDPFEVRMNLVPIGFEKGEYLTLLQVGMPGTPLQGAAWDVGATLVSERKVRGESSGRIQVSGPGVPVVLESEVRFKPGSYEIVSVAHEAQTGLVTSEETTVTWPAPGDARAVLTPIALLQQVSGVFLREGETRLQGSLAREPTEGVAADLPTALIGLVCHSRRQKGPLRVERRLTGRGEQSFDPLELDLADDRCVQVRDVLPEGSLTPGFYRYEMRVLEEGQVLQEQSREFYVLSAGAVTPAGES